MHLIRLISLDRNNFRFMLIRKIYAQFSKWALAAASVLSANCLNIHFHLTRQSTRSTAVGKAKAMSYEDTVEARARRDAKEAIAVKVKRGQKRKGSASVVSG